VYIYLSLNDYLILCVNNDKKRESEGERREKEGVEITARVSRGGKRIIENTR
jgi:hypothetical protein